MPRALNLVPALRLDSLEIKVKVDGNPVLEDLAGDDTAGMLIVLTKPRMADVRIFDASRASLSRGDNRERKSTSGRIMNEFHNRPASRESSATVAASENLLESAQLAIA